MNTIIKIIVIVSCFSLAFIGCGGGELNIGASLDSGADTTDNGGTSGGDDSSGGTVNEITAVALTDELGVEIGDTIVPNKAIIATFDAPLSDLNASMVCDGEEVALDILAISGTQVSLTASSGRFPQLATCVLRLDATAMQTTSKVAINFGEVQFEKTLTVLCDVVDDFSNPKSIGCWKRGLTSGGLDLFKISGGMLSAGDLATTPDMTNIMTAIYKRVGGMDYDASLHVSDVLYNFSSGESQGITYAMMIGANILDFNPEPGPGEEVSPIMWVGYTVGWRNVEDGKMLNGGTMLYRCIAGSSIGGQIELDDCGDGSVAPMVGVTNDNGVFLPYYSFDGKNKKFFFTGSGDYSFDMTETLGAMDDLDVAIIVLGDHTQTGFVLIDDFMVEGDASFVQ